MYEFEPISCHWCLSIPLKISEKFLFPDVVGGIGRNQWHEMRLYFLKRWEIRNSRWFFWNKSFKQIIISSKRNVSRERNRFPLKTSVKFHKKSLSSSISWVRNPLKNSTQNILRKVELLIDLCAKEMCYRKIRAWRIILQKTISSFPSRAFEKVVSKN